MENKVTWNLKIGKKKKQDFGNKVCQHLVTVERKQMGVE